MPKSTTALSFSGPAGTISHDGPGDIKALSILDWLSIGYQNGIHLSRTTNASVAQDNDGLDGLSSVQSKFLRFVP
jgi:hypothetical protein